MLRNLFSVAGFTLLSRVTGFLRDVMLGAVLGAGMLADAFFVAFKLPNHFRAIFGENAFNAAYVPTYAQALEKRGPEGAREFSGHVLTLLFIVQAVLLVLAWIFMPELVGLIAPGFLADPQKFELAVTLTRITFPYLLCVTLVTLWSGTLNALGRFAVAAFASVLLNLAMIALLGMALLFPNAAFAAAWGIFAAGVLEVALLVWAVRRAGAIAPLTWPKLTADVRQFFKTVVPATIGSAGVQIAIFADTIIATRLPTGSLSAMYYADRLYQLPVGVIGIAAGTVLLPEMSRRIAANEPAAACDAQNRTMALTLALAAPFFVAFLTIAEPIIRGVYLRGNFTEAAASLSASVLMAYGFGLLAIVLLRAAVASFLAQGDTKTPMYVSLGAVAVNVALKIALYEPMGIAGLAFATAAGAWINFGLLVVIAMRRGWMQPDAAFWKVCVAVAGSSALLALVAWLGWTPAQRVAAGIGHFQNEIAVALLAGAGIVIYGVVLVVALRALGVRLGRLPRQAADARQPASNGDLG